MIGKPSSPVWEGVVGKRTSFCWHLARRPTSPSPEPRQAREEVVDRAIDIQQHELSDRQHGTHRRTTAETGGVSVDSALGITCCRVGRVWLFIGLGVLDELALSNQHTFEPVRKSLRLEQGPQRGEVF